MASEGADLDLLRRRVLNVVGHELRTPVTTMAGLADQLLACDDEATRQQLTVALARNAHRLDRLVEDLLLAASISTVVPIGAVERLDLVETARAMWTGPADATFDGAAWVCCRPDAVSRALGALLDNAAQLGEDAIVVTGVEDGEVAAIEVASGGPELPAAELELACELLFRGERAVTAAPGLGVGLAVARTLARAEGGDVTVRGGTTGGVIARLELPCA